MKDTVSEWLRRSIRNRLGLSRVGSSPASVVKVHGSCQCRKSASHFIIISNKVYYVLYITILLIIHYARNGNYIYYNPTEIKWNFKIKLILILLFYIISDRDNPGRIVVFGSKIISSEKSYGVYIRILKNT